MHSTSLIRGALLFAGCLALAAGAAACSANVVAFGDCVVDGNSYAEGDTFTAIDGCNQCTCEAGGNVSCTAFDCATGCVYEGVFHSVGEKFDAGDGCNACSCDGPGNVTCTSEACGCDSDPPACAQPGGPCTAFPQCDGTSWTCVVQCDDCSDQPPIDCLSPPGCFYDGPVCIDGQLSCGELICDECAGDPPACPDPGDPNCFTDAVCGEFGWECEVICNDLPCEEQYPEGYQTILYLFLQACGCIGGAPCEMLCVGTEYCGGDVPSDSCGNCLQDESNNQGQCVTDAAFGPECQNDPECSAYVECVIAGG